MDAMQQIQYSEDWRQGYPKSTGHAARQFVIAVDEVVKAAVGVVVKTVFSVAALVATTSIPASQSIPQISLPAPERIAPLPLRRTAQENLQRIRDVFAPAISALAKSLGVQRQSIYNWQNGEAVNETNASKLEDLAKAADLFASEVVDPNHTVLERKFVDGKTLLQIVQDGGSAQEAIRLLIPLLKHEEKQRKELDALFAKRKPSESTADFDLPAPNDAY